MSSPLPVTLGLALAAFTLPTVAATPTAPGAIPRRAGDVVISGHAEPEVIAQSAGKSGGEASASAGTARITCPPGMAPWMVRLQRGAVLTIGGRTFRGPVTVARCGHGDDWKVTR